MLILLVIIYLAFISLGLPDALLGSSWPSMSMDLGASLDFAGAISMVVSIGTVLSSLLTVRLVKRYGIGLVMSISVLLTALALLAFSFSQIVWMLIFLAIPLGLGAGAVDSALNAFVAEHYQSKHMNYLHSFWGVGATTGPLIMANYLMLEQGWREGYFIIAMIQLALVIVLTLSLPLWKKALLSKNTTHDDENTVVSNMAALKVSGVKIQLVVFFCYCAIEVGTGLWAASFLIIEKSFTAPAAAFWVAIYYLGITLGRFACGTVSDKLGERSLIRMGVLLMGVGTILLGLPYTGFTVQAAMLFIGVGCAPIFPNTIHLTPNRFGRGLSQTVIGLSMAVAYLGNTLVPPALGVVLDTASFALFPGALMGFVLVLFVATEKLCQYDDSHSNRLSSTTKELL
ncbi:MFS transporter [Marinomonas epiphytica]